MAPTIEFLTARPRLTTGPDTLTVATDTITIELTDEAKELLLSDGYDEQFGARPLKRAIQRLIQDPLALKLLEGEFGEGDSLRVGRDGEQMTFEKVGSASEAAAVEEAEAVNA